MIEPRRVHWVVAKHVLKYLCRTLDYGLDSRRGDGVSLVGYVDVDLERKSTSRCFLNLGSMTMSWFSADQSLVALSSVEVDYMEASQASCEALWIHNLLVGFLGKEMRSMVIYCEN